jgi:hypothetical protein
MYFESLEEEEKKSKEKKQRLLSPKSVYKVTEFSCVKINMQRVISL